MDIKSIRALARSYSIQSIYARMKDGLKVNFFKNDSDFANYQLEFLKWIEAYHYLYQQLGMKESYLSEKVIANDIDCDAYLYYLEVKDEEKKQNTSQKKTKAINIGIPNVYAKGKV